MNDAPALPTLIGVQAILRMWNVSCSEAEWYRGLPDLLFILSPFGSLQLPKPKGYCIALKCVGVCPSDFFLCLWCWWSAVWQYSVLFLSIPQRQWHFGIYSVREGTLTRNGSCCLEEFSASLSFPFCLFFLLLRNLLPPAPKKSHTHSFFSWISYSCDH